MKLKRIFLALIIAGTLAGCSSPRLQDGYQIGDATGTAVDGTLHLLELRHRHCQQTDPVARALLLRLIRTVLPAYPAEGICTDILSTLEATDEVP
ncbi:hypothetical protein [Marinobacterium stanieri]|uniref:Lipoprotein n=1 Tax=Marinobacterium stanieri TaxID=49186 RepID=A0A1N6Q2L1_9GAMM|nr:hypothetical protein [Marinobacterium stanieri]SIQ10775.1 hypothetical protein SAMN05421647_102207 [Marinobacterium stanieri]